MNTNTSEARYGMQVENAPWFRQWFDSMHYYKLYAHRNEEEATRFLDALLDRLQPPAGCSILDLGCGTGRHSRILASEGYNVTGIDLSFMAIREAKKYESEALRFIRQDMRVPFGSGRFDFVFNFFTSFGYFKTAIEHNRVIRNMSQALKPGGRLVLDYLNVAYAESGMIPEEEKSIDGVRYNISRYTDANFFYKKIRIYNPLVNDSYEYVEQVAKFGLNDFNMMFAQHGLRIVSLYGDYKLGRYHEKSSPRLILVAQKN